MTAKSTETMCPHCNGKTETGTHGGCGKCGKVKHTSSGRRWRQETPYYTTSTTSPTMEKQHIMLHPCGAFLFLKTHYSCPSQNSVLLRTILATLLFSESLIIRLYLHSRAKPLSYPCGESDFAAESARMLTDYPHVILKLKSGMCTST